MSDLHLQFARNGADFTLELLEKIKASNSKENVIVSPFSIQSCMGLVYAGAKDETAQEIATALKFGSDSPQQVAETFQNVLQHYSENPLLKIANKLYVRDGANIKPEYAAITKEKYQAEAESIDFVKSEEATLAVNKWVEIKTAGIIKELLPNGAVDESTSLVLLNVLHFKGEWQQKFDETKTSVDDFWVTDEIAVPVHYMNKKGKFHYTFFNDLQCSGLEMQYKNSDLSMFVLLPEKPATLVDLQQNLQNVNLVDLTSRVHKCQVMVKFPKFKVDSQMKLKNVLKEMGVAKAFGHQADFSNILDPAEPLSLSQVYHKACIEVNEVGSEAAAATAVVIRKRCAPTTREFEADHPFLYWIWNKKTILFAGAFVNAPKEA